MTQPLSLNIRVLHCLHFFRCGTVSLFADALGERTDAVSYALRHLAENAWARRLGYSRTDPQAGLHGIWWIPSRKDPRRKVWKSNLCAVMKPLDEIDAEGKRVIAFENHLFLRRHDVIVAKHALETVALIRERRWKLTLMSETYLRTCLGWYSNLPKVCAARQATGWVVSVPDFRLVSPDGRAINVEIELSRKSIAAYQRVIDQAEAHSWILFAVPTTTQAQALANIFRYTGMGRTRCLNPCLIVDLPKEIEAAATSWGLPGFYPSNQGHLRP